MSLELWIPDTAVPAFVCRLCQKPFGEREAKAYERHVLACCRDREAAIHEDRPSVKNPLIQGGIWDKDLEKWLDENSEAVKEGRLSL